MFILLYHGSLPNCYVMFLFFGLIWSFVKSLVYLGFMCGFIL